MDAKTKFTPGPWCIARSGIGYPYQIDAPNGVHVRSVTRWGAISVPSLPEGEANARLIAAAPTMYAALKRQQENIRRWIDTGIAASPEESRAISDAIDAALAEADGEA